MIEHLASDGILTLRLNYGKAGALDIELMEALSAALDEALDARAVVLTGSGDIFSAGVDLPRLVEGGPDYARRFLPVLDEVFEKLFALPRPVVAALNGHAVAGGCMLALACDHRLMVQGKSRLGIPELRLSVPFPPSAIEVVQYAVGATDVEWLLFSGETLSADAALRSGIVDEVVPHDRLMGRALEVAGRYAGMRTENFSLVKRMLRSEAVDRIRRRRERFAAELEERWCDPGTHDELRTYVRDVLGK